MSQITKRLNGIGFGFYDAAEIKKLSVKEITNTLAFDQINRPLENGLYDPALGVSPYEKFSRCHTCGQEGLHCPGHLGHIELVLPVYNPFLMDKLQKLLASTCLKCHKIRVPDFKKEMIKNALILTKLGYLIQALDYEQAVMNPYLRQKENQAKEVISVEDSIHMASDTTKSRRTSGMKSEIESGNKKDNETQIKDIMNEVKQNEIKRAQKKIKKILKLLDITDKQEEFEHGLKFDQAINAQYAKFCQDLFDGVNSQKCMHCGSKQNQIKKEGYSKFFIFKKPEDEDQNEIEGKKQQHFLNCNDVKKHIKLLFSNEKEVLSLVFGNLIVNKSTLENCEFGYNILSNNYQIFFIDTVPVPPNRFRPENKMNDQTFLHQHTVYLTKLLQLNTDLKSLMKKHQTDLEEEVIQSSEIKKETKKITKLVDVISKWLEMQDIVNSFYDSTKAQKRQDREGSGIKQMLEKKEGLFRMKMMGKRVNYAARSVISPDPSLNTNEVGVPLFMAKKLTFPENVNEVNSRNLKQLIINGPQVYPGANSISENGNVINLESRTLQQRQAIAKTLLSNCHQKTVQRHLQSGDILLFNRQPTLHKPSIMSHIARVLPKEQTIRMHYANCNSYNADFDGDEMNLHFLQSYQAKAEGKYLSLNDINYLVPKDGKPIRGLIQDNVFGGVYLTMKDQFFTKEEFQQLIYLATWSIVGNKRIQIQKPTLLKPKHLWTGKQVISNIIEIIVKLLGDDTVGVNMNGKTRLASDYLGPYGKEETQVIIRDNQLLSGVIDKAQIGNSEYGLVHAFFELYGADPAGKLLSSISKVTTAFIQMHGFTCGVSDLTLNKQADIDRKQFIEVAHKKAVEHLGKHLGLKENPIHPEATLNNRPNYQVDENGQYLYNPLKQKPEINYISDQNPLLPLVQKKIVEDINGAAELDMEIKGILNVETSSILKLAKKGLLVNFPDNFFSGMVLTGAKGSMVNHNQVTLMLGQQELEGRRVPIAPSGKTLPSFLPYDPNPRSSGFITDRFLTGLRAQDFYFHCMAGREGLIDTAVKTSRSGYLQRCLVKHLENLSVSYDGSVRDMDGGIVQFYYGEDGIETINNSYLNKYDFVAMNHERYTQKYGLKSIQDKLESKSVKEYIAQRHQSPELKNQETIMNKFNPSQYLGAISEKALTQFTEFCSNKDNQDLFKSLPQKHLFQLINAKYFNSLVHPGEGVGATAAQSIGEPSTQMTLNTFHLAGHGGANVTLGIPRLREILMTATDKLKTPSMTLYFKEQLNHRQAQNYNQRLQIVPFVELIQEIMVTENVDLQNTQERVREYKVEVTLEQLEAIEWGFNITPEFLKQIVKERVVQGILNGIEKIVKKGVGKVGIEEAKKGEQFEVEVSSEEQEEHIIEEEPLEEEKKPEKITSIQKDFNANSNKKYFDGYKFSKNIIKMKFKVPLDVKKILMVNLVESVLSNIIVNEIKGIQKSHLIANDDNTQFKIQTEGINFSKVWGEDYIDHKKIHSNDIQAIRSYYGIEAGRNSIIEQIHSVFAVYHISVDFRHLSIIADYMSFSGHIKAMNRVGMNDHASALLRMSFETTMKFLIQASLGKEVDNNDSFSSSIVLGRVPKVGTGVFDLRHSIH